MDFFGLLLLNFLWAHTLLVFYVRVQALFSVRNEKKKDIKNYVDLEGGLQ